MIYLILIASCTFQAFAWFSMIAYVVHLVLQIMEWRKQGSPGLPDRFSATGAAGAQNTTDPEKPQY